MPEIQPSKKSVSAKESSKWGQIIASIWIASWCTYSFITEKSIGISDIVFSGFGIAVCFLPTYVSIITDKIKEIKMFAPKEP